VRPVCILSIGRSGTSIAARVVNLLGVDLGAEGTMLEPTDNNPRGFWEQQEIMFLNDEILAALGGSYEEPPERPPGWEHAAAMDPFRDRIRDLVARTFTGRWGFKDPRTAMTLPLWRSAVGEFDYVICARNPLEVEASLRPVIPEGSDAIALWLRYMCEALRQTAGRSRTFVFYDEWYADPLVPSERLAAFLGGELDASAREQIKGFVDPGLRRHEASEHIPGAARALHALLPVLAAAEQRGSDDAEALQTVASALDDQVTAVQALTRERDALRVIADSQSATLAGLRSSASWRLTAPLRAAKRRLKRA
jgi:hypothetical protein